MTVSVILVNFNDGERLSACLDSLREQSVEPQIEVIVVDNASTDGSGTRVPVRFPEVRWLASPENAGFARANNTGVKASKGEFLLFLNTDTVVPAGTVSALASRLAAAPRAAAAGPALVRPSGRFQVSFGRSVGLAGQALQKLVMNPIHERTLRRMRGVRETGWLSAACLLCRRSAFEAAGGFDEEYFLYFEDIDLCARLRKAGGLLLFDPSVRVAHAGGSSTAARPAASRFEYRRSQVLFYKKHRSRLSVSVLLVLLRMNVRRLRARGAFAGEDGAVLERRYARLLRGDTSRP
jgi:GT2 family glycosyltransferase